MTRSTVKVNSVATAQAGPPESADPQALSRPELIKLAGERGITEVAGKPHYNAKKAELIAALVAASEPVETEGEQPAASPEQRAQAQTDMAATMEEAAAIREMGVPLEQEEDAPPAAPEEAAPEATAPPAPEPPAEGGGTAAVDAAELLAVATQLDALGLAFTPVKAVSGKKKPDHAYQPTEDGKPGKGLADLKWALRQNWAGITSLGVWCNAQSGRIVVLDSDKNHAALLQDPEIAPFLALAPKVTSPRKNAAKYLFKVPADVDASTLKGVPLSETKRGYEILWGKSVQAVVCGRYPVNEHVPEGGVYTLSGPPLTEIPDAPEWLLQQMRKPEEDERSQDGVLSALHGDTTDDLPKLQFCLEAIPPEIERGGAGTQHVCTWRNVGKIIHRINTRHSSFDGLEAWREWSKRSTEPAHIATWESGADPCREEWSKFRATGKDGKVADIASLIAWAKKAQEDAGVPQEERGFAYWKKQQEAEAPLSEGDLEERRQESAEYLELLKIALDPAEVFPAELAKELNLKAAVMRVPPYAFIAPMLAATASLVGRQVEIRCGDIETVPIIWATSVGDSGSVKSPVTDTCVDPLLASDAADAGRHARELADWRGRDENTRGPEPQAPHTRVEGDATVAALRWEMAKPASRHRGLLMHQDELMVFLEQAAGADKGHYMAMWGGKAFKVNRRTSESFRVEANANSLLGNVTTADLFARMEAVGELASSGTGFFSRFLVTFLPVSTNPLGTGSHDISEHLSSFYTRLETSFAPGTVLMANPEAAEILFASMNRFREISRDPSSTSAFQGVLTKLQTYTLRFAGVLAAMDAVFEGVEGSSLQREITADHAQRAVALANFFLRHWERLLIASGNRQLPTRVVEVIGLAQRAGGQVNSSQLRKRKWKKLESVEACRKFLQDLVDVHGIGRIVESRRADVVTWELPAN